jgi:quercetin dioxygenase-like cupin family protein
MRGEQLWFMNTLVTIRISYTENNDHIAVIESRAPFGDSPPLHVHHTEDEVFHILEGEVRFVLAGEESRRGPGEILVARKGVPHTYRVESPTGAQFLTVTTKTDFERFVRAMARPAERLELPPPMTLSPDMIQTLARMAKEYGIEFVGPPLT